jgi:hypothetical protein
MLSKLDNKEIAQGRLTSLLEDIELWRTAGATDSVLTSKLSPAEDLVLTPKISMDDVQLTKDFAKYCREMFHYFRIKYARLTVQDADEQAWLLRRVTELLHEQWMVARQALLHRYIAQGEDIRAIDGAAQAYYAQVQEKLKELKIEIGNINFYIYLDKLHSFSRSLIPGTGFISIPLSFRSKLDAWEMQAIPHEVAHNILETIIDLEQDLTQVFEKALQETGFSADPLTEGVIPLWRSWRVEVLCDVLGTLLAGADNADSVQTLCLLPARSMLVNDKRHPLPFLRPFIHLQVLDLLVEANQNSKLAQAADELSRRAAKLRKRWQRKFPDYQDKTLEEQIDGAPKWTRISDLYAVIEPLVKKICTTELESLQRRSLIELLGTNFASPVLPQLDSSPSKQKKTMSNLAQMAEPVRSRPNSRATTFASPKQLTAEDLKQVQTWLDTLDITQYLEGKLDLTLARRERLKEISALNKMGSGPVGWVALPEDRKVLAWLMAEQRGLIYNDALAQLSALAVYEDLQRPGSGLSADQALAAVNAGLSLTTLGYVTTNELVGSLNMTEPEAKALQKWAMDAVIEVITLEGISIEKIAQQREFFFFLIAAAVFGAAILFL